ncbi:MAG: hypothetical protein WKF84_12175 [Pyrinomonadaceae bacterium]
MPSLTPSLNVHEQPSLDGRPESNARHAHGAPARATQAARSTSCSGRLSRHRRSRWARRRPRTLRSLPATERGHRALRDAVRRRGRAASALTLRVEARRERYAPRRRRRGALAPDAGARGGVTCGTPFDVRERRRARLVAAAHASIASRHVVATHFSDVLTELGRTYHFAKPATRAAPSHFMKKRSPSTLGMKQLCRNLINALLDANRRVDAERRLDELQQVNPSNPGLSNLKARLLAQAQNAEHN